MEDGLIDVPTMRRFAGIDMISDRIPDETTILTFRHLLEKHNLGKQGTIIDATLIAAPSSTFTRAEPECVGGTRTRRRRGIRRCTKPERQSKVLRDIA
jgi:hypothetical protein